jgi:hypothetical protein
VPDSPDEPSAQLAVVLAFAAQVRFEFVAPSGGGEDAEEHPDCAAEQAGASGDGQGDHDASRTCNAQARDAPVGRVKVCEIQPHAQTAQEP